MPRVLAHHFALLSRAAPAERLLSAVRRLETEPGLAGALVVRPFQIVVILQQVKTDKASPLHPHVGALESSFVRMYDYDFRVQMSAVRWPGSTSSEDAPLQHPLCARPLSKRPAGGTTWRGCDSLQFPGSSERLHKNGPALG